MSPCGREVRGRMLRSRMQSWVTARLTERCRATKMLHEEMSTLDTTKMRADPRLAGMEWPKITLVTAVYKGAEDLEATIRSVMAQEYPNLEYIVVDDGAKDERGEIFRKNEGAVSWWSCPG